MGRLNHGFVRCDNRVVQRTIVRPHSGTTDIVRNSETERTWKSRPAMRSVGD